VLDHALAVVEPQLSTRARIVRSYGLRQPVLGDEGRLGQVFLQLLANAAQAIPEGHPERNEVRIRTLQEADGRAVAEVSDTGHGIAPEILPRIFEPFFTTKDAGEGTGLGLSICHATIQSMGGEIQVESEPGRGATFRVLLPTAPSQPDGASRTGQPAEISDRVDSGEK
jgi:signal transduction histidine kinase